MLTFQPAFDPFHSVFRLIRLFDVLETCKFPEFEKVRILDFYLMFPFRSFDIKFKRGQTGFRNIALAYDHLRPYGGLPDDRDIFVRMLPAQLVAVETLAARGIVDPDAYKKGVIAPGEFAVPDALQQRAQEINKTQSDLLEMLGSLCENYVLLGPDGLKQRTGLLDHRYDVI